MEIESKYKVKLLDFIQDYSMTTVCTLLRYMRKSSEPNFSITEACKFYDELIDNGYTLERIVFDVIYETCCVSGFLSKKDLEEMKNFKETNQEIMKEKKKQEILQA